MNDDFTLYTHEQLIKEIKEAFDFNKKSGDKIFKMYKKFLDKYPPKNKIFNLSWDTDNALKTAFQLMNAIKELSNNINKIESKKINSKLVNRFIELGTEAKELYHYHRKSFHENEEEWNDVRKKLSKNHAELVIKYFYAEMSDHIHYMELLHDYGLALKRYEGEDAYSVKEKISNKSIINIDFPEEINWEKVTIKLKEGLKDVEILYNEKFIQRASYEEIGFSASKKDLKESRQWELLKILSVLLSNPSSKTSATPKKLSEMLKKQTGKNITVENVHQIKKSLSATLQEIFKTQEDPFMDYKFKGYYEIKFKLLPEPILRGNGGVWTTNSDYNDNIGGEFDSDE